MSDIKIQNNCKDICIVTEEKLDLMKIYNEVLEPSCGAISTFVGVTRDHFNGKKVIKLEYEAYKPMAEKELFKICKQVREKWEVVHIAIYHKTGLVPIGDASVIIAISSVHRDTGLEAVHWAIDELKATVPIWKKEFYEDGSVWKGNAECRHTKHQPKLHHHQHHDPTEHHTHDSHQHHHHHSNPPQHELHHHHHDSNQPQNESNQPLSNSNQDQDDLHHHSHDSNQQGNPPGSIEPHNDLNYQRNQIDPIDQTQQQKGNPPEPN